MFEVLNFEPRTLNWWFDEREDIDLDPPYQRRGNLWAEKDRRYLLDSILNGFDLPKVYIADFTFGNSSLNLSGKRYAVIDGKQRLQTIFDFFGGRLTLDRDFVWLKDTTLRIGGLSYQDLVRNYPKVASKFSNFPLTVMRVITDDEAKINDLFVRLNKGKPLTGPELRNAMGGLVPRLIREISVHDLFANRIKFSDLRRQVDNVSAKLLLIEFRGKLVDTKKVSLDRFVQEGQYSEAQTDDFSRAQERVMTVCNKLSSIFVIRDPLLSTQGPVPLYYWLVRDLAEPSLSRVREFLNAFDTNRKQNRVNAQKGIAANSELLDYDLYDRSTNDQISLEKRLEILRRHFLRFTEALPSI